jgi:Mannosyltransferase (PIG-V)
MNFSVVTSSRVGRFVLLTVFGRLAFAGYFRAVTETFVSKASPVDEASAMGFNIAWMHPLIRWDAAWYLSIVKDGYRPDGRAAFFPLFPYVTRLLSAVTPNIWVAGLLLNAVCLMMGLWLLVKWMESVAPHLSADVAVLFALTFPSTVFFSAFYTEAPYFLFVTATLVCASRQQFALAAAFGATAAFTRSTGVLLCPALVAAVLFEWRRGSIDIRTAGRRIGWSLGIGVGLLAYMAMLWQQLGQPFAFLTAQQGWGRGQWVFPLQTVWRELQTPSYGDNLYRLDALAGCFGIGVGVYSLKKRDIAGGMLTIMSMVLPLSTGTSMSLTRFLVVLPPVYRWLVEVTQGHELRRLGLLALSTALCAYVTARFALGSWAG